MSFHRWCSTIDLTSLLHIGPFQVESRPDHILMTDCGCCFHSWTSRSIFWSFSWSQRLI
jgi:hypothetical protein